MAALRPVFIAQPTGPALVRVVFVEFEWIPGRDSDSRRKNSRALHEAAKAKGLVERPLEASTKSDTKLGLALSPFNLDVPAGNKRRCVESLYLSSKVFEGGGPYLDIAKGGPMEAKRDERLKTSGELIGFQWKGQRWPADGTSAFYDWLYMNALSLSPTLAAESADYDGFTDIEFNPNRGLACQAYAIAKYHSLTQREELQRALSGPEEYRELMAGYDDACPNSPTGGGPDRPMQKTMDFQM